MAVQDNPFAKSSPQELPEEIAQLAYRFHSQPGLRQFTSCAQADIEDNVFGPRAAT
jgi:hypothetical protein